MSLPKNASVTFQKSLKKREKKKEVKPAQQQIDRYLEDVEMIPEHIEPLHFWIEREYLALIAINVLTIPISSVPVE